MATAPTIPAVGDVLRWARIIQGLSLVAASDALGIAREELEAIEDGTGDVTNTLLKRMARAYHQTESVLLLPSPPKLEPFPPDFRTSRSIAEAHSQATRDTVRWARRLQEWMTDLAEAEPESIPRPSLPAVDYRSTSAEVAGRTTRLSSGISTRQQLAWKSAAQAFRMWRSVVEAWGILVLVKSMPWEDCRGFVLWSPELIPTIVINSNDSATARCFTLMHEYAHLLIREPAICVQDADANHAARVERWCNQFAAAFLMPEEAISFASAGVLDGGTPATVRHIQRVAARLRVSPHAAARRLDDLGLSNYYRDHAGELVAFDRRNVSRRAGAKGPPPAKIRLAELGPHLLETIGGAVTDGSVSIPEAAAAVDLSAAQFRDLIRLLQARES